MVLRVVKGSPLLGVPTEPSPSMSMLTCDSSVLISLSVTLRPLTNAAELFNVQAA